MSFVVECKNSTCGNRRRNSATWSAVIVHADLAEHVVRESPARIAELIAWGTRFDSHNGALELGREGGHSHHRIVHALGDQGRFAEAADARQQDCELVAAETREQGLLAADLRHAIGDEAQQPVARRVAVDIVDGLEAIEIHVEQGQAVAMASRQGQIAFQLLHEHGAVGQAREGVVLSHEAHRFFSLLPFGDIRIHAHEAGGLQILITNHGDAHVVTAQVTIADLVPDVALPEPLVSEVLPHLLIEGLIVLAGFEQAGALALDFGDAVTGELAESAVGREDPALRIAHHDPLAALLEHRAGDGALLDGRLADLQRLSRGQVIAHQDAAHQCGDRTHTAADQQVDPEGEIDPAW